MGKAYSNFTTISFGSGLAKYIISWGRTSGIPPTFVDTIKSPALAASTMAMQKASVRGIKKICPLTKTFLTFLLAIKPYFNN